MNATINFNLDDPDDVMAFNRSAASLDMALALWKIKECLYDEYVNLDGMKENIGDIIADLKLEKLIR
jgi:hypothetical protein